MSNLHELTKQLDVLTWNSRSVLNALVRSAMAAGSSDGFTVTRAGNKVVLTKMDIFAIYHFYEEWEAEGYPDGDAFYDLVDKHNKQYDGSDVVTTALAKHAKTMWMDASNVGNIDNAAFWLDKIASTTNPKWLTNTAPIPLNVRTPIYDENLSTKTYDSYETYLFPSGYYSIDTLGYRGDGMSHSAGGRDWIFDIDDKFQVMANYVLLGDQSDRMQTVYKNAYRYNQPLGFALAGGTDSFALYDNSIAYGNGNVTASKSSAIIGGSQNSVMNFDSGVFGGAYNNVLNYRSVVGGGELNQVNGSTSFAANSSNRVGGYSYIFQRFVTNDSSETKCQESIVTEDGCIYNLADTGLATSSDGMITLSASQIYIPEYNRTISLILNNTISSGDNAEPSSPFDFKVNDLITLYEFVIQPTGIDGSVTLKNGRMNATVTAIKPVTAQNTGSSGGTKVQGYIVSLDKNINTSNIPELDNNAVMSGRICRSSAFNYPIIGSDGKVTTYDATYHTRDSAVFGYNNIAAGDAQTVVGASNLELLRPRFVVGSGTSYIQQSDNIKSIRDVSLVSAPNYTYQKATQYVVAGISTYTTAYIHGDYNADMTDELRRFDEDYNTAHVEKYEGFYAYSDNYNKNVRAVLRVFHKKSLLSINDTGLHLKAATDSQTYSVLNELYSRDGSVAIYSTDDTAKYDWIGYHKTVADTTSTTDTRAITIWAKDVVGIHGNDVRIDVGDGRLIIRGSTKDALTAHPTEDNGLEPYVLATDNVALDTVTGTGHYYCRKYNSAFTEGDIDLGEWYANKHYDAYHVFESSKGISGVYDVAQIIIPGRLKDTCTRSLRGTSEMPHPLLCVTQVSGATNSRYTTGTNMICEQLAYLSDIANTKGATVCYNKPFPAYSIGYGNPSMSWSDPSPEITYSYDGRFYVQDIFLNSLVTASEDACYSDVRSVYAISSSDDHAGKLVRASSFSNYAGTATTLISTNTSIYLNGVALNPMMTIVAREKDTNNASGIGYLAYGPSTINVGTGDGGSTQKDIYTNQLASATPSDTYKQNLTTSRYSRGTLEYVSNLRDVWFTAVTADGVGVKFGWERLMSNVHMTFAGGHLSVEFLLSGYALSRCMLFPTEKVSDQSSDLYGYVIADTSVPNAIFDNRWQHNLLAKRTLSITLPVDPEIGNHLVNANNAITGVAAQMYGHMYHTSNDMEHVDITGVYFTQQVMPQYNPETDQPNNTYGYNGPNVSILIRMDESGAINSNAWYFCHLEGVVNYVN